MFFNETCYHSAQIQSFTRATPEKDKGTQRWYLLNFQFHNLQQQKTREELDCIYYTPIKSGLVCIHRPRSRNVQCGLCLIPCSIPLMEAQAELRQTCILSPAGQSVLGLPEGTYKQTVILKLIQCAYCKYNKSWEICTWTTELFSIHGRGVGAGDELILQSDKFSEFRVLLKSVSQAWNTGETQHNQKQSLGSMHVNCEHPLTNISNEVLGSMPCVNKVLTVVIVRVQTLCPLKMNKWINEWIGNKYDS